MASAGEGSQQANKAEALEHSLTADIFKYRVQSVHVYIRYIYVGEVDWGILDVRRSRGVGMGDEGHRYGGESSKEVE